jgi:nicotinate-nucleotide adenylyltransferase
MAGLGIFGGTFDPPHLGHLILAAEACNQLHLERLLWVLTPEPPHKLDKNITPIQHRSDMLHVAIAGNPCFELSTVDIDRQGPHYAIDTVRILSEQQPGVEWTYLIGGDSLKDLHTWQNPHELVRAVATLGVMLRPGVSVDLKDIEQKISGISTKVKFINAPLIDISASDIRQRVADGRPYRYFVSPDVYKMITDRGLYRIT